MNLNQERKIKFWLATIVKVLVGVLVIFKLIPFIFGDEPKEQVEPREEIAAKDTLVGNTADDNQELDIKKTTTTKTLVRPAPNTASIYIFDKGSLDSKIINHLGKSFFKGYTLKAGSTIDENQLLVGNLSSSANTELVCVGTVNYNFYKNSQEMTTCEVNLTFETYNKTTGSKVSALSRSFSESGPGFTNAKALQVALQKIYP